MIFLVLKFILAAILTAIPFVHRYVVKPRSSENRAMRNIFSAINYYLIKKIVNRKSIRLFLHFKEGMIKMKSFRKFFTLVLLLVLLSIQFIDINLPPDSSSSFFLHHDLTGAYPAALITMPFISYKSADKILLKIKNSFLFSPISILILTGISFLSNLFIFSESIFLIMLASLYYPTQVYHPSGIKQLFPATIGSVSITNNNSTTKK